MASVKQKGMISILNHVARFDKICLQRNERSVKKASGKIAELIQSGL